MQKIEIRLITLFSKWLKKNSIFCKLLVIKQKLIYAFWIAQNEQQINTRNKSTKNHVKTQETMNKIGDFMTYYLIRDIIKKMICLFVKKKFLTLIINIHNR